MEREKRKEGLSVNKAADSLAGTANALGKKQTPAMAGVWVEYRSITTRGISLRASFQDYFMNIIFSVLTSLPVVNR
jgi:hypothetical protein